MQSSRPPSYRPPLKRPQSAAGSLGGFVGRCPHLGTAVDAGTALAFASDANQCYSTRLPVPVSMIHQQSYCLSTDYSECPVFQQSVRAGTSAPFVTAPPTWGVVPEETVTNVVIAPRAQTSGRRRSAILPLIVLLALLAGGWWLWRGFLAQPEAVEQAPAADLAVGAATVTVENVVLGSVSGDTGQAVVLANPTSTPEPPPATDAAPRPDASGISLPVLPTTSSELGIGQATECDIPDWWVPYVVQADDSVLELAQLRGLLAEDVVAANCLSSADLVVGQVILLPPLAVVIGVTPLAPIVVPTRAIGNGGVAIIIVATQSVATPLPVVPPSPPPATADAGSPNPPPPPPPAPATTVATATAFVPTRVPPTATVSSLFPAATPPPIRPTATAPSVGPTPTPPPLRP